jgi:hypothetical protein
MKIKLLSICAVIALISLSLKPAEKRTTSAEYEIAEIYEADELISGSKVLLGDKLSGVSEVFNPTNIQTGKYTVYATLKATNLYQIDGKNIFIQTRSCNEYASSDQLTLLIELGNGYSKGKLIF